MKKSNKHLTYEERRYIEIGLNEGKNFAQIGKEIEKHRTTVMREIQEHKFLKENKGCRGTNNRCIHRQECHKFYCTKKEACYEEEKCELLEKPPYVCNGCEYRTKCRKIKYIYYSKFANDEYQEKLRNSRIGINISKSEIYEIDKILSPLILERNQNISHIYSNHAEEIGLSRATLYKYINLGVFTFKNIDLPRLVRYKKRKRNEKNKRKIEKNIRKNRTMEDFKKYIEKHQKDSIVEMDTVEGIKGGKVLLTLIFRKNKFMLIFLLENKNCECVENALKSLRKIIGIEKFKKLFKVILTDNGSEFSRPQNIEIDEKTGKKITRIFYCDPAASWQKGIIEKNHEYIRYILPKGSSFEELTQKDINLLMTNINNICRDSLKGKSPYELMLLDLNKKELKNLGIEKLNPDDVNLSPLK